MRVALERLLLEHRHRVLAGDQWTGVAPRHAPGQDLEIGLQPHGYGLLADQPPRFGIEEGAAAGGKDVRRSFQQPGDHPPLSLTERLLAECLEDVDDRAAGGGFDFGVRVLERHPQRAGQTPANAALTDTHQADEGDGLAIEGGKGGHLCSTPLYTSAVASAKI